METHINQLFSSYLKGGAIWPQIRGGINIHMLSTIANIQLTNKFDWKYFLDSELSEKQLAMAYKVMDGLHIKSGVSLSTKVNLQDEWQSAKAAIFKSLLYFIFKKNPDYKLSIKELLTFKNADIIQKFIEDITLEETIFYNICINSKSEINKFTDLAELFVYYISKKNGINKIRYQEISDKYKISLRNFGDIEMAKSCLSIVNGYLYEHLKSNYSEHCFESVCWGFELPQYLK